MKNLSIIVSVFFTGIMSAQTFSNAVLDTSNVDELSFNLELNVSLNNVLGLDLIVECFSIEEGDTSEMFSSALDFTDLNPDDFSHLLYSEEFGLLELSIEELDISDYFLKLTAIREGETPEELILQ